MPFFERDGVRFHFQDRGAGAPFVFQHGLGGDTRQILDLYTPPPGVRLITLDSRAHGATAPLGDTTKLNFNAMADDLVALLDHLDIASAVIGGISMGAGVALNVALRHPQRLRGLILSRPAWLDRPLPPNLLVYPAIAWLLRTYGAGEGRRRFAASGAYAQVLAAGPDAAASLLGQFEQARARARVARLERIPLDSPCPSLAACSAIAAPALILATCRDPIHPVEFAEELAGALPAARLVEVTSKSADRERHRRDVQAAIDAFLADVPATQPSGRPAARRA